MDDPARIVRLAAMSQVLLGQTNSIELDEAARQRLADIYDRSVDALAELLSEDLRAELRELGIGDLPEGGPPTPAELHVVQAQLVGWLEGLFHGIRTALATQHLAQQEQLAQLYADALRSARQQEEKQRSVSYM